MTYKHDIFISYKRNEETHQWIIKHFLPLLKLRVELELGKSITVFIDDQIESGVSWPLKLGDDLGRSKILLPLWSRTFFSSNWCVQELSHMLAREKETKRRTIQNPSGLIIPAVIHDGDTFPVELKEIQYFEIQKCFTVRMSADSKRAEELEDILTVHAPAIASAISSVPEWKAQWSKTAAKKFYDLLKREESEQNTLPRYTTV